jgi:hypothetical protein
MAAPEAAAAGGPPANAGPAPVLLSWPLPGCRPGSLGDLFSARALAELAREAGAAGGAVVLDLCGHVLQAPAGGRPGLLHLLESGVPPAGLRSLALRNGTLALRPGTGLMFSSTQPFDVSLECVKVTRLAPTSGSGRAPAGGFHNMVGFAGAVSGLMRQCRVELSPAGPAGDSVRQEVVGGGAAAERRAGRRGGVPGGGAARPALSHEPREPREHPKPFFLPRSACELNTAPAWCWRTWTWWPARAQAPAWRPRVWLPPWRGSIWTGVHGGVVWWAACSSSHARCSSWTWAWGVST